MKLQAFKYYWKEGFKGVKQNRLMSVASIGTTVATLLILGIFLALTTNVNHITRQISRDCEMQAFINENSTQEQYDAIGEEIKQIPGVLNIEKYTKVQILEEMRAKLKDKQNILDGFDEDNPFRDSFKITLTDLNVTQEVYDKVVKINGVENVTELREAAEIISKIADTIKTISIWFVIILCVVAAFIISNTIKLSVFARRKEINIMKYIGATDWFIRWPFVIEGILIGIYGAIISFGVIWLLYGRVYTGIKMNFAELLPFGSIAWGVALAFAIVGIVIGAIGSAISIRKYLKV